MKTSILALLSAIILFSIYSCECRITCNQQDYRVLINTPAL